MKKLMILVAMLFMATSAQAYFINYDDAGTSTYSPYDRWELDGITKNDPNFGAGFYEIFTYQDVVTGDFEETFTMRIARGTNSVTGDVDFFSNFYATVTLSGNFNLDTSVLVYDDGFVQLFKEGDTNDGTIAGQRGAAFDSVNDVDVATLSFQSALIKELTGSLLGGTLSLEVDTRFVFDTVNPDYFSLLEQDLTAQNWLFSVVGGRIIQQGINIAEDPFVIAWNSTSGLVAEFDVVPEPSTYLLLGLGLAGLAFYRRKRS